MGKTGFSIVGAGNAGHVFAAHLSTMGYDARVYDIDHKVIKPIQERGGIELSGVVEGFGKVSVATANIKEAIEGVDVILVATPAHVHKYVAEDCAPYLEDGQIVVLNPGRTFGAIEFINTLRQKGVSEGVIVAEAQTLIYLARRVGPAQARMLALKKPQSIPLAAFPAKNTKRVLEAVKPLTPYGPAQNILETSLNNFGALFHPIPALLNAGRIESAVSYKHYQEGITPSVAEVVDAVDRERLALAVLLGAKAFSIKKYLYRAYGATGETLYEAIQNTEAYGGVGAPNTLKHRFMFEDIPTGLVPYASLGDLLGVPMPATNCIIQLASILLQADFWREGRTVEKLGLAGLGPMQIRKYANEGKL